MEVSGFFGDSAVSYDVFLETVLWEDVFAEADTWEEVLLKQTHGRIFCENRHMVFFWKLPGKGTCDVLLEWMPLCALVTSYHSLLVIFGLCWSWSSLTMLHGIGSPCHSLLVIVCRDWCLGSRRVEGKRRAWCQSPGVPFGILWPSVYM